MPLWSNFWPFEVTLVHRKAVNYDWWKGPFLPGGCFHRQLPLKAGQ